MARPRAAPVVGNQRPREGDPLLLAAAEQRPWTVFETRQADEFKRARHPLFDFFLWKAARLSGKATFSATVICGQMA